MVAKARSAKAKAAPPAKDTRKAKRKAASSEDESDAYESDAPALDSDALDDEDDEAASPAKRKRASSSKAKAKKASPPKRGKAVDEDEDDAPALDSDALDEDDEATSPAKRARTKAKAKATPRKRRKAADDYEEDEDELELAEGQMVVGRVVQAPTTGRVPPGQISRNTLDFLAKLADPACNDRQWFKLHDPVFRLAEGEFKAFVEAFTDVLADVDAEVPPLPPRDVIHRIYRDVRFSNDKTPYKRGFSASFSRSGRKGKFAHYHVSIRPGQSLIAAGCWCPARDELATIRAHLLRNPARFRRLIGAPAFTRLFGAAAHPGVAGEVQNVFGREDELKNAPKGVPKDHKDIDLLRLRSFAVALRFTDAEVLDPGFKERLGEVALVMRPFVRYLNEMITLPADDADEGEDAAEDVAEENAEEDAEAADDEEAEADE